MIYYPKILFDLEESRMALPGYLNDVAPQHAFQWNGIIDEILERAVRDASGQHPDKRDDLPLRVETADRCDVSSQVVPCSRAGSPLKAALPTNEFRQNRSIEDTQEQKNPARFIEWRDVRDVEGRLLRVELTTETREYWAFLASVDPNQTLQLLADFARVQSIDPSDVYGRHDPFATTSTPELRKAAFLAEMAQPVQGRTVRSTYNNGKSAIAFMSGTTNSLSAAIASRASRTRVNDGQSRSDPVGIYITQAGTQGDLLMPDRKTPVPQNWMRLSRGKSVARNGTNRVLSQRLVVEPDPESGLILGDLFLERTGLPVTSGADIARLVTISLHPDTAAGGLRKKPESARLQYQEPRVQAFPTSILLG